MKQKKRQLMEKQSRGDDAAKKLNVDSILEKAESDATLGVADD